MNENEILNNFIDLYNKNASDAEKFSELKYQYGIASRKIHELKGTNALLRERLAELEAKVAEYEAQPQPIDFSRLPRLFSELEDEQAALGLTLKSTNKRNATGEIFIIKYTTNPEAIVPINREVPKWWALDKEGNPDAWDDWESWLRYGPFVEVLDVAS